MGDFSVDDDRKLKEYCITSTDVAEDSSSPKREKWSNHVEYLLATLGYAVGIGNLWRFPYICNINGGGAFLIPFVFFLLACGVPLFLLESAFGQFAGKNPIHAFSICPVFIGVGYGMVVLCIILTAHYNMIMAWTLFYLSQSMYSTLPWTTCGNSWNSDQCNTMDDNSTNIVHGIRNTTNMTVSYPNNTYTDQTNLTEHSSSAEYWKFRVLDISEGIEVLGDMNLHLLIAFLVSWVLVFLCVVKGLRSIGKVVYVTSTLPYLLLLALLIRAVTLPGAVDGIIFYLKPDFTKLLEIKVSVGYGMVVLCIILTAHYNMIMAWTLFYLSQSMYSTLPWTTCGNSWNSDQCNTMDDNSTNIVHGIRNTTNMTVSYPNNTYTDQTNLTEHSSSAEYWKFRVLDISEGIEVLGDMNLHLLIAFLVSWVLVFLCVVKGLRSIGKVVYVTSTLPYLLLLALLIRAVTLPGAVDGIIFYLKPDFTKLLEIKVWIEAAIQVFYSLGPGFGILIALSSHNKFNTNVLRDSILIPIIGEGTSIYGGIVIFACLGFMAKEAGVSVSHYVSSGPGLAFVVYPQALAIIPLPQLWSVLFFLTLFSLGVDSQFCYLEVIFGCFIDTFQLAKRKVLVKVLAFIIYVIIGLPLCTQGGMYVYQLVDWYCAAVSLFFFGVIECLIFGWIYGTEKFGDDIKLMIGRRPPYIFTIFWKFITPTILAVIMLCSLSMYEPPTYDDYHYPAAAQAIGWMISILPMIPVLVFMIKALYYAEGSLLQRIRTSIKPGHQWISHINKDDLDISEIPLKTF